MIQRFYNEKDYKFYNKIANEWNAKYANGVNNDIDNNDILDLIDYNHEITELITNFENELDKVNEYYIKLMEVIEENKNKINEKKRN